MKNIFRLNVLNQDMVQVYGLINGICYRKGCGSNDFYKHPYYSYDISFFANDKVLVKIQSGVNNKTISSIEKLEDVIYKIYLKEVKRYANK